MVKEPAPARLGVILAGGMSKRMNGVDKAAVKIGGRRLIDCVVDRLAPQVDRILIAGPQSYETGLEAIADRQEGPRGPAAALWSAAHWITKERPEIGGFVTAPVDGPFLPSDLYDRLASRGGCAVACDDGGVHPTFAYWALPTLLNQLSAVSDGAGLALHDLARRCAAAPVDFSSSSCLMNVNSPEDIVAAEEFLASGRCARQ